MALPVETKERIARIFDDPEILEKICMYVANGGSVIQLAKTWDIPASTIFNWLRKNDERSKMYDHAKADRNEWIVESVLNELKELALAFASDAEGSDLKQSNKLKAAELVAKHQKLFVERHEHTGQLTIEDLVLAAHKRPPPSQDS
jgi:transposase-like protein